MDKQKGLIKKKKSFYNIMSIINKMIGQKQKNIEDSRTMMLYQCSLLES